MSTRRRRQLGRLGAFLVALCGVLVLSGCGRLAVRREPPRFVGRWEAREAAGTLAFGEDGFYTRGEGGTTERGRWHNAQGIVTLRPTEGGHAAYRWQWRVSPDGRELTTTAVRGQQRKKSRGWVRR